MGGDYHTINRLLTRRVAPAPEARGGAKLFSVSGAISESG